MRPMNQDASSVIATSVSDEAIQSPHPNPPPLAGKGEGRGNCFAEPVLGQRHSVSKTRVNALSPLIRVLAMTDVR
jgi:hypothetical protein